MFGFSNVDWSSCLLIGWLGEHQYELNPTYQIFVKSWQESGRITGSEKIFLREHWEAEIVYYHDKIYLEFPNEEFKLEFLLTYG